MLAPFALLAFAAAGASADPGPTFRIEVHPLRTSTLSTQQFLAGTTAGAPDATIAGELRLPTGAPDRLPAVMMLHGDAGAVANQPAWTDELNRLGIAVFTLDSFSGRGAVAPGSNLSTMPASVGGAARIVDAERALALLARHPRIDPARIAVMGFSSGGRTVLVAAQRRFAAAFGTPDLHFAAYVALYPPCNVQLADDTVAEPGPQRIFIGEADLTTTADSCRRHVDRLRRAGVDAEVTTFPGASHGFDNESQPTLTRLAQVPTQARCDVVEAAPGRLVNVDTGRPLGDDDACVGKGFVAGYDREANRATRAAVARFFVERFGLKR